MCEEVVFVLFVVSCKEDNLIEYYFIDVNPGSCSGRV